LTFPINHSGIITQLFSSPSVRACVSPAHTWEHLGGEPGTAMEAATRLAASLLRARMKAHILLSFLRITPSQRLKLLLLHGVLRIKIQNGTVKYLLEYQYTTVY
jgi:hypothetical protein